MRIGVGDGRGEGEATGVGVWANTLNGDLETARPAAPTAGSNFTKLRRLIDVRLCFFIVLERGASCPHVFNHRTQVNNLRYLLIHRTILHLHNLRFAGAIDSHHVKIVVFSLWNHWILWATKGFNYFRHRIVVAGDENRLA